MVPLRSLSQTSSANRKDHAEKKMPVNQEQGVRDRSRIISPPHLGNGQAFDGRRAPQPPGISQPSVSPSTLLPHTGK
jgi:hypothetical protein